MPLAVISDIHANLEALEAVLADIDGRGIARIVCLGDLVGYGPNPEEVVRLFRNRSIPSVVGNHEMGVLHDRSLSWFNPKTRANVLRMREMLSRESKDFLATLPRNLIVDDGLFVHGFPPKSPFVYLYQMSGETLAKRLAGLSHSPAFVGHTHELVLEGLNNGNVESSILGEGKFALDYEKCIVNVGSVGQPRDRDRNAKYVVWDKKGNTIGVYRVPYDADKTVAKIKELGFPDFYGERLLLS
ncbi:metallophosphoesterase family protein [Desulfoplanes sp.]